MRGACSNKKTIRVVREPLKGLKLNQLRGLLRALQRKAKLSMYLLGNWLYKYIREKKINKIMFRFVKSRCSIKRTDSVTWQNLFFSKLLSASKTIEKEVS